MFWWLLLPRGGCLLAHRMRAGCALVLVELFAELSITCGLHLRMQVSRPAGLHGWLCLCSHPSIRHVAVCCWWLYEGGGGVQAS